MHWYTGLHHLQVCWNLCLRSAFAFIELSIAESQMLVWNFFKSVHFMVGQVAPELFLSLYDTLADQEGNFYMAVQVYI